MKLGPFQKGHVTPTSTFSFGVYSPVEVLNVPIPKLHAERIYYASLSSGFTNLFLASYALKLTNCKTRKFRKRCFLNDHI